MGDPHPSGRGRTTPASRAATCQPAGSARPGARLLPGFGGLDWSDVENVVNRVLPWLGSSVKRGSLIGMRLVVESDVSGHSGPRRPTRERAFLVGTELAELTKDDSWSPTRGGLHAALEEPKPPGDVQDWCHGQKRGAVAEHADEAASALPKRRTAVSRHDSPGSPKGDWPMRKTVSCSTVKPRRAARRLRGTPHLRRAVRRLLRRRRARAGATDGRTRATRRAQWQSRVSARRMQARDGDSLRSKMHGPRGSIQRHERRLRISGSPRPARIGDNLSPDTARGRDRTRADVAGSQKNRNHF